MTAGNSSPYSDGAAAVVVMSREKAEALGLKPLARFVSFAVAGVEPDVMGIGPVKAVPKALQRAGLTLDQIALIEFNEAFAAQVLAVMRVLEMPEEKTNVNGGAIALGHPLGATGAKLTAQLLSELSRRGGGTASSPCASAAAWAPRACLRSIRLKEENHDRGKKALAERRRLAS